MKLKRLLIITVLFSYLCSFLYAGSDEGMWLPLYIKQLNERKMQQMGMKLTAEDIYSINHASIKDAVLRLGSGFCTGELVSENGLVFTNHHCGYDAIAELSSVQNDYLTNGFWAESYEKEIPIPNFTVSRLVYMKDITDLIKEQTKGVEEGFMKTLKVATISDSVVKAATYDTHFDAEVKTFFGENEYYLLVYETFRDVRFVGAPPSAIGKFGGDTDNWMWPRHTGDFSVLRVYTSPDGLPADYSTSNIPYKPMYYLPISLKGVKDKDFSMTLGYPAETERYLTSYDIDFKLNHEQPAVIGIFGEIIRIMKEDMDKDPQVKLSFAADYAEMNNTYKYYVGQNLGLKKYGLLTTYLDQEVEFNKWLKNNPDFNKKYGTIFSEIESVYKRFGSITPGFMYMGYGVFRLKMINHIYGFSELLNEMADKNSDEGERAKLAELKKSSDEMFSKMYFPTEKKILKSLLVMFYHDLKNPDELPFFKNIMTKYKGKTPEDKILAFIEKAYAGSILFDKVKLDKFYDNPSQKTLSKDPALKMLDDLLDIYRNNYAMTYRSVNSNLNDLHSKFIAALREWKTDKVFYPDANSTMRMSYGKVIPYYPRDAVYYDYKTTYLGILQKENPNDDEFVVPPKLHDLLIKKDFGRYAKNDTLYTCFLSDNDISGGNSGSPVINGEGQLIGLAFDGNWEAMTGDLMVNPKYNRTINVDIRYVLFIIDKFAGQKRLINELRIVE